MSKSKLPIPEHFLSVGNLKPKQECFLLNAPPPLVRQRVQDEEGRMRAGGRRRRGRGGHLQ